MVSICEIKSNLEATARNMSILMKRVSTVIDARDNITAMMRPATGSACILVSHGSRSRDTTEVGMKFKMVGAIVLVCWSLYVLLCCFSEVSRWFRGSR